MAGVKSEAAFGVERGIFRAEYDWPPQRSGVMLRKTIIGNRAAANPQDERDISYSAPRVIAGSPWAMS
jgi:hypothetical protein